MLALYILVAIVVVYAAIVGSLGLVAFMRDDDDDIQTTAVVASITVDNVEASVIQAETFLTADGEEGELVRVDNGTIVGKNAFQASSSGARVLMSAEEGAVKNTIVGENAAPKLLGSNNILIGEGSGKELTDTQSNIGIGNNVFQGTSTGNFNIAVGHEAVFGTEVTHSTSVGNGLTVNASNEFVVGNGDDHKLNTFRPYKTGETDLGTSDTPFKKGFFSGTVSVATPVDDNDAATKEYVDNNSGGGGVSTTAQFLFAGNPSQLHGDTTYWYFQKFGMEDNLGPINEGKGLVGELLHITYLLHFDYKVTQVSYEFGVVLDQSEVSIQTFSNSTSPSITVINTTGTSGTYILPTPHLCNATDKLTFAIIPKTWNYPPGECRFILHLEQI